MKLLGTTDDHDRCDCCGTAIKLGVVLEVEAGADPVVFGRYCAAKTLGWGHGGRATAERRVTSAAIEADCEIAKAARWVEVKALLAAGELVKVGQSWVPADLADEARSGSTAWFNVRAARYPRLFGYAGLL